jgi:hypothetical protein
MTIRLPDETDVLVRGAEPEATRDSIARALRQRSEMPSDRSFEIADLILAQQNVGITCADESRARQLCTALRRAGCHADVEE